MNGEKRTPLSNGTKIKLNSVEYVIRDVIGYGGSCIAYTADRLPNEYEQNVGLLPSSAVIKEFYPNAIADEISRVGTELKATDETVFAELKNRFKRGAASQVAFYGIDSNHSLPPAELADANETAYSAISLMQGVVLSEQIKSLGLKDIADIITSLCNAVKKLHSDNKLYLDIKPSNIFLFDDEPGETRRVALFDFDTVTPTDDLDTAAIPYSPGWSPPEQENEWLDKISFASDVYAIGATLYWLFSGEKPSAAVLSEIARDRTGFLSEIPAIRNEPLLREHIGQILLTTLKRLPDGRAQRVEDIPI
jgi:serine/threonine protein kinase